MGQETTVAGAPAQLSIKATILEGLENTTALHPTFGHLPGTDEICMLVGGRIGGDGNDTRGRLRVFRNIGTRTNRQYGEVYWLDQKVPSTRIPAG